MGINEQMFDLNVKVRGNRERTSLLKRATELGWSTIAWNSCVVGKVNPNTCKPVAPVTLTKPDEDDISLNRTLVTSNEKSVEQLNRVTITIDDVYDAQSLTAGNEALKAFDIVAVCPGNAKVFTYLCKTAEIDIISIDFSHKVPFSLNKKLVSVSHNISSCFYVLQKLDEAVKRGIFFEISYGSMLQTPAVRRELISGTRVFIQFLRGNNLIISSGCDGLSSLRGPFDAANIGRLLRLTNEQALKTISDNCEQLLSCAAARKLKFIPAEVLSSVEYAERQQASASRKRQHLREFGRKTKRVKKGNAYSSESENNDSESDHNGSTGADGDKKAAVEAEDDDFLGF